ncbi:MAG TPA: flap endonuclease-1 [Nitrososphaerales archaeon]|nr:flap endonuclease-1 [Nitrososphaerales archaeon]
MGVDLGDVIPRRKVPLESLSSKRLAVDAYNTLYQFLAIIRGMSGEHLKDSSGRVTSHLSGLFYRNVNLLELNMKLVYVFDGAPPELKATEIDRRRKAKEEARRQYTVAAEAGDTQGMRKYAEASTSLRQDMVVESKELLDAMGIPWVDAPSEGEAQAAVMATEGTVDAVASQDHDSLLFGAPLLARNITISGKRRLPSKNVTIEVEPETISLQETLQVLDLTRDQLIDFGILMGTDFNPDGFKGIGPARGLKLLKTYHSLERIEPLKEEIAKIDYQAIRSLFLNPPATRGLKPSWGDFKPDAIKSFLVDEHSFSAERVDAAIERVVGLESAKSESLEKWFG